MEMSRKYPSSDEILKGCRGVVDAAGTWPPGWCAEQLCPVIVKDEENYSDLCIKKTKVPSLYRVQIDSKWFFGTRGAVRRLTPAVLRDVQKIKGKHINALEMRDEPCLVLLMRNDDLQAIDDFADLVKEKVDELKAIRVETISSDDGTSKVWNDVEAPFFVSAVRATILADTPIRLQLAGDQGAIKIGLALAQRDRWFIDISHLVFFSESDATSAWNLSKTHSSGTQSAADCLRRGRISTACALLSGQPLIQQEIHDDLLYAECEARALKDIGQPILTTKKSLANTNKSIEALMAADNFTKEDTTQASSVWKELINLAASMEVCDSNKKISNFTKLSRLRRLEDRLVRASKQKILIPFAVADALLTKNCTKEDQLKRVVASGCADALISLNLGMIEKSIDNTYFSNICSQQRPRVSRASMLNALKMPGLAKVNHDLWRMRNVYGTYEAVVNAQEDAFETLRCIQSELGIPNGELMATENTPRIRLGLLHTQDVRLEIEADTQSALFNTVTRTILSRLRGSVFERRSDEFFMIFDDQSRDQLLPCTVFCVSVNDDLFDAHCVYSQPPKSSSCCKRHTMPNPRASPNFRAELQFKMMLQPLRRAEQLIHALLEISKAPFSDTSLRKILAADIILAVLDAFDLPYLFFPYAFRAMLVRAFGSTAASSPQAIVTNLATHGLPALGVHSMNVLHDLASLLRNVRTQLEEAEANLFSSSHSSSICN